MKKQLGDNIVLIGFSTTGKSQIAKGVAELLGWDSCDTDAEIVQLAGKEIPQIFAEEGEGHFRKLESEILHKACSRRNVVIATGGGAVLDPQNQQAMTKSGMVILLEARPETIYERLEQDRQKSGGIRPLLEGTDPLERIRRLKVSRQPFYSALAAWTVNTDCLTIPEVCQEVIRGWHYWRRKRLEATSTDSTDDLACEVVTGTDSYPIYVNRGLLDRLGELLGRVGLGGHVFVISDDNVYPLHGERSEASLRKSGFKTSSFVVPAGEATKSLDTASRIYDWLVDRRAERGDCILALGGGMVGDLAGFVAATFLRGVPFVQAPTTLLAMVDASIGGKTAVNHLKAKNFIGSFYQPRLVVADVETLATLPARELTSGWAEVIKHAFILDAEGVSLLEDQADDLIGLKPEVVTTAIRRSAAIKAGIVSEDEKEKGRRTLLNYGHTIAHGLETATDYERFLHGEAVAVGMVGAASISQKLGLISPKDVKRHRALLEKFGLPTRCSGVDAQAVLKAMELDKKVRAKAIRWVLLNGLGQATIRSDVPLAVVRGVVEKLVGGK